MAERLRLLLVEDSEDDSVLLEHALRKGGFEPDIVRVDSAEAMERALRQGRWDIVLSDYALPGFDGLGALELLTRSGLDVPFLIVSGTIGEDVAVSAMRSGAADYIMKDALARLPAAIERELAEAEVRRQRRQAQEESRRLYALNETIVQGVAEAILMLDEGGSMSFANPAAERLLGGSSGELRGRSWASIIPVPQREAAERERVALEGRTQARFETTVIGADGRTVPVIASARRLREGERTVGTLIALTDIGERVRAETSLQALNRASLAMAEAITQDEILEAVGLELRSVGLGCLVLLLEGDRKSLGLRYASFSEGDLRQAERVSGIPARPASVPLELFPSAGSAAGVRAIFVEDSAPFVHPFIPGSELEAVRRMVRGLKASRCVVAPLVVDGSPIGLFVVAADGLLETDLPSVVAFANQVAAAWHKAELLGVLQARLDELRRTQDQLVQAQKMEAVGRLAGGIAHDFNNYLTAVSGYAELLLSELDPLDPHREEVNGILRAVQGSSALTRQLLAFSRKQVISPRRVDPNELVRAMGGMIGKLIEEDMVLRTELAEGIGAVEIDSGQFEQVIMNLVVNARDAMAAGGVLTIATAEALLPRPSEIHGCLVPAGSFVTLSVSDTGAGMDEEVVAHLFEPFFTTKVPGKGTGLGLATVYGIVKQSNGHITVRSTPGVGTSFTVYLPRVQGPAAKPSAPAAPASARNGSETVLVVEDDEAVRALTVRALRRAGYRVLQAESTDEGADLAARHEGVIDLVITDVITPGKLTSREMAERIVARGGKTRVLFMSGYAGDAIASRGVLDAGIRLLPKPFTVAALLAEARAALDARGREAPPCGR